MKAQIKSKRFFFYLIIIQSRYESEKKILLFIEISVRIYPSLNINFHRSPLYAKKKIKSKKPWEYYLENEFYYLNCNSTKGFQYIFLFLFNTRDDVCRKYFLYL